MKWIIFGSVAIVLIIFFILTDFGSETSDSSVDTLSEETVVDPALDSEQTDPLSMNKGESPRGKPRGFKTEALHFISWACPCDMSRGDSKEKAIMGAAAPKPPLAIPPHNKLRGFLAFSRELGRQELPNVHKRPTDKESISERY